MRKNVDKRMGHGANLEVRHGQVQIESQFQAASKYFVSKLERGGQTKAVEHQRVNSQHQDN